MCQNRRQQMLTFQAVLKVSEAPCYVECTERTLIRATGTVENQRRKLITVRWRFRSVLRSAPLPVLIDKLHNILQRVKEV